MALDEALAEVELRSGMRLPRSYRESHGWLWVWEAEWIPPEQIGGWELPTTGSALERLVPFAFTGAGDPWCWAVEHLAETGEPEIWFCPHDADDARVFAPSLVAWLVRNGLEAQANAASDEVEALAAASSIQADWVARLGHPKWARRLRSGSTLSEEQLRQWVLEELGERYLAPEPWQRPLHPRHVPAEAELLAADEASRAEVRAHRFSTDVPLAEEAFRAGRYVEVVARLSPYEDLLSAAQRAKLVVARRRAR